MEGTDKKESKYKGEIVLTNAGLTPGIDPTVENSANSPEHQVSHFEQIDPQFQLPCLFF